MNSWKRRWRIAVAGIGAAMAFAAACGSPDRGMKSQESAASGAVNEESADKSVASDAEPRPGLLENASPDTSALTLFYYDGETVTQRMRGMALGAAWYMPEERQITPLQALLDQMCMTLGGRAAEELALGEISTGALNDLEKVTKMAYAIVVYYGMSEKLPNVCYYDSTGQAYGFSKPYGGERAKQIDDEVSRIIGEQYERAKRIISEHKDGHARLAETLLTKEVMYSEDLKEIFGERQWRSRTEEIMQLQAERDAAREAAKAAEEKSAQAGTTDDSAKNESAPEDVEAVEIKPDEEADTSDDRSSSDVTPPPFKGV